MLIVSMSTIYHQRGWIAAEVDAGRESQRRTSCLQHVGDVIEIVLDGELEIFVGAFLTSIEQQLDDLRVTSIAIAEMRCARNLNC
jgi:hypothetical protein